MPSKKNPAKKTEQPITKEHPFEIKDGDYTGEKYVYNRKSQNKVGSLFFYDYGDNPYWKIKSWSDPYEFMERERTPNFQTDEEAALFLWNVTACSNRLRGAIPVPQVVIDYITEEIRVLRPMLDTARNTALQAYLKKRSLQYFAKQLGLEKLFYELEDKTPVKDLLEFKISHKGEEIPFFSESFLYDLIGKEDARTVLALLTKVVERIDPVTAEDL